MKAICAWCGVELGTRPGPASSVTHGVCQRCAQNVLASLGIRLERDRHGVARPAAISAASQPDGKGAEVCPPCPDISGERFCECSLPSRTTAAVPTLEEAP